MKLDNTIFRAYDIRGTYPLTINEDIAYIVGKAYGSKLKSKNITECLVGYDNRLSSISLSDELIKGIIATGVNVTLLGLITTPMIYFMRTYLKIYASIMITASHNPKDDNGFKFSYDKNGNVKGEEILELKNFIGKNKFEVGNGTVKTLDVKDIYINALLNDINPGNKKLKVVVDFANGTPSIFKSIFEKLNFDFKYLNDTSDGNFPNHHPDPAINENMIELRNAVLDSKSDLGLSFDGDGDRLGIIDNLGNFYTADIFACLFIKDILTSNPNKKILCDIKCSKTIYDVVASLGGTVFESRTGASYTMSNTINENCVFGVEYSGHIYFNDRKIFPITSGIYSGLRLLEILSQSDKNLFEMLNEFPKYYKTDEIKIATKDEEKYEVVNQIKNEIIKRNLPYSDIDGVKIKYEDGWALVRASNTGPNLTCIFEFNTKERLEAIKKEYFDLISLYKS